MQLKYPRKPKRETRFVYTSCTYGWKLVTFAETKLKPLKMILSAFASWFLIWLTPEKFSFVQRNFLYGNKTIGMRLKVSLWKIILIQFSFGDVSIVGVFPSEDFKEMRNLVTWQFTTFSRVKISFLCLLYCLSLGRKFEEIWNWHVCYPPFIVLCFDITGMNIALLSMSPHTWKQLNLVHVSTMKDFQWLTLTLTIGGH